MSLSPSKQTLLGSDELPKKPNAVSTFIKKIGAFKRTPSTLSFNSHISRVASIDTPASQHTLMPGDPAEVDHLFRQVLADTLGPDRLDAAMLSAMSSMSMHDKWQLVQQHLRLNSSPKSMADDPKTYVQRLQKDKSWLSTKMWTDLRISFTSLPVAYKRL